MKTAGDQDQRRSVLDVEASFIVQAPAGSGKTELLIQRYLKMLTRVEKPEEVIAITFTRKAASEMRNRILNALEDANSEKQGDNESAQLTAELVREVMARDQLYHWHILDYPARLRIQTIDALTANLTRQMPLLSRFGAQPETLDDAEELYRAAAANTLAELENDSQWSTAIAVLIQHLDNNLPRVRDLLAGMLARRDQWMRHIVQEHPREHLEAAIAHQVSTVLSAAAASLPGELETELLALLRYAAANMAETGDDTDLAACRDLDRLPGVHAEALAQWRAISTFLLTRAGAWRKRADASIGFPAAGRGPESETRAAMKQRFTAFLSNLTGFAELQERLQEIAILPPLRYSDSEWEILAALYQLLKLADAHLRVLFAERNQMDFCGISQAAIEALGPPDSPTDLALHLDYRIRHILVDEFQDISINQAIFLERLTAGWSSDDGHSLFLVGDPMQSIYRFREAEVGLFTNTWQQARLGQVALRPVNIHVNFRSEPGIVDWVNRVFSVVLPKRADPASGAVHYVEARAYHEKTVANAVHLHPLEGKSVVEEAEQVRSLLEQTIEENPVQSIAILVRNRAHLKAIIPRLAGAGIPYQAVEIEAMGQRMAIQDLLNLSLALDHFADRVAWLSILRAPWCGLTLKDLERLVAGHGRLVWECMQDEEQVTKLSEDGQQRLARVTGILESALASRGRKPLARWLESIWLNLGGPACVGEDSDLENCRDFFQLLAAFTRGGKLRERDNFRAKVDALYARTANSHGPVVQVMTIHKSKGLEFDTVILPGLARGSAHDPGKLLMWMESPQASHPDLLLAPIKQYGEEESPIFEYLRFVEKRKQQYELGRLLYVASTRARRQLHLMASLELKEEAGETCVARPGRGSLLAQLWPALKDEISVELLARPVETVGQGRVFTPSDRPLIRLAADWSRPAPVASVKPDHSNAVRSASRIEFSWAGEGIRHAGTVVHRAIMRLAQRSFSSVDASHIRGMRVKFRRELQALGLSGDELEDAMQRVEEALLNMLGDSRAQWIFADSHSKARNEYAISGLYRGKVVNVVLDRMFTDMAGIRWIVDYKTSRHEGGDREAFLDQQQLRYREQLEKYACLVQALEPGPVKLGLYFPLLQGWREWDMEAGV